MHNLNELKQYAKLLKKEYPDFSDGCNSQLWEDKMLPCLKTCKNPTMIGRLLHELGGKTVRHMWPSIFEHNSVEFGMFVNAVGNVDDIVTFVKYLDKEGSEVNNFLMEAREGAEAGRFVHNLGAKTAGLFVQKAGNYGYRAGRLVREASGSYDERAASGIWIGGGGVAVAKFIKKFGFDKSVRMMQKNSEKVLKIIRGRSYLPAFGIPQAHTPANFKKRETIMDRFFSNRDEIIKNLLRRRRY